MVSSYWGKTPSAKLPHLFIFKFIINVFNVMIKGMHCINNASSIFLFNILYVFASIKMMYFECQNKQFEGKKTRLAAGRKIIIKRIKVNFISQRQVSAVVDKFVKQVFKKQWPNSAKQHWP